MRKSLLLLLLFIIPTVASAAICVPNWVPQYAPEFRFSYFRPNSSDFRSVYVHRAVAYDFDLNVRLYNRIWLWQGIGYFTKQGKNKEIIIGKHPNPKNEEKKNNKFKYQKSQISLVPVTVGVKIYHCIAPYIDAYAGVGARWDFVRIVNKGHTRDYPVRRKPLGIAAIGGLRMILDRGIYISPFVEYSNNYMKYKRYKNKTAQRIRDVGSAKIGLGIGAVI